MMNKPPTTFGKRGRPPPARTPTPPLSHPADGQTTESGVPLAVLAASLVQKPADAEPAKPAGGGGTVPTSWRAGVLAGLVVSLMQAGMVVAGAKAQSAPLSGLAALAGIGTRTLVPVAIAGSLLDSAQTTGFTVLIAHRLLKRLAVTSPFAYALGGGAVAAVWAAAGFALGFGAPAHGWLIEIMTGLGAGFFYRLFAGANERGRAP